MCRGCNGKRSRYILSGMYTEAWGTEVLRAFLCRAMCAFWGRGCRSKTKFCPSTGRGARAARAQFPQTKSRAPPKEAIQLFRREPK